MIRTLSTEEVIAIHNKLVEDFAAADDPISPAGIKSQNLLESAVSRQHTGFNGRLKYDTPVMNAASFAYRICCNHPFHNGNKRISLVAMLCHLDKNDLTFDEATSHGQLYDFILKFARHGFADKHQKNQSDEEVFQMSRWIRKNVRSIERNERLITFRELKTLLNNHGFQCEDLRDNSCDVVRYEEQSGWFGRKKRTSTRIMRMGYRGDGQVVDRKLLREVRRRCNLTEQHGVDSHVFYTAASRPPDYFVATYRGTLRRLARI